MIECGDCGGCNDDLRVWDRLFSGPRPAAKVDGQLVVGDEDAECGWPQ